jgi:hypothetical protein
VRIIAPPPTILATRHVNIQGNKTVSVEEKLVGVRRSVETPVASPAADSQLLEDTNDETGTTSVLKTQVRHTRDNILSELRRSSFRLHSSWKSTAISSPTYWGFSFKSTGGVTRDPIYRFDISTAAEFSRDTSKISTVP